MSEPVGAVPPARGVAFPSDSSMSAHDATTARRPTDFAFTLQPDAHAPGTARHELTERLAGHLPAGRIDDVLLLATELVTNSVRHSPASGEGTIGVAVRRGSERIRVEVSDPGSGFDHEPHRPGTLSEGGRGLFLVDALADRWGMGDGSQTTVWFELSLQPAG